MSTKDGIRGAYDLASDKYAESFRDELTKKHFDRIILSWLALEKPREETILELGCGPGEISGFLAGQGAECLGTDLSPRMIDNAKKHFPGARFEVQDFHRLSYESESFSRIVAYYAIVNLTVEEIEKAFMEVLRVLKPNGLFLFTFHVYEGEEKLDAKDFLVPGNDLTFYFFEVDDMKSLVEKLGFKIVDILIRHPYPDAEYQSKRAYFILRKP